MSEEQKFHLIEGGDQKRCDINTQIDGATLEPNYTVGYEWTIYDCVYEVQNDENCNS